MTADAVRQELGRQLGSRFSSAVVLYHSAIADRLGLNVTDYKCAEIVLRIGPTHPGRLAEITGMSTAAVAQVLARLERAGLVKREPDPTDRRRTLVHPVVDGDVQHELGQTFRDLTRRMADVVDQFDDEQIQVITEFIAHATEALEDETVTLRKRPPSRRG